MEQYSSDRIAAEVLKRHVLCEEAAACLDRVAQGMFFFSHILANINVSHPICSDFSTAVSRKYYDYVEHNYIGETGEPRIKAFSQNIVSAPIEMIMLKVRPSFDKCIEEEKNI